jgi:SpoVK/Ycf46/Vps4 family AAA+-type ATPase
MHIHDLIISEKEPVDLNDVFLDEENRRMIQQIIKEYTHVEALAKYGLPVNNKILLHGASGCGKTMTAKAIAQALGKPLLILNLSNIICSRIGETGQNMKIIFDKAIRDKAVLFLDEFDQVGKARDTDDRDVGEMRRLVNTIIQLIDYLPANTLLIGATNHIDIVDTALLRRFQLKIGYELPSKEALDKYYDALQERFPAHLTLKNRRYTLSYAEAKDYMFTELKSMLIAQLEEKAL